MRIILDVSPVAGRRAGIGRYTHQLLAALARTGGGHEYGGVSSRLASGEILPPPLDALPRTELPVGAKGHRLAVLLASFGRVAMDRWMPACDVFHATDHLLPPLHGPAGVITAFDLTTHLFPEYHTPLHRWYDQLMLPRFLKAAGRVIAISESTRRDCIRLMGTPEDKITVVHLGVDPAFHPVQDRDELARVAAKYGLPAWFVLYFGTLEPRKNLPALLEAYGSLLRRGQPAPDLVIAGRRGWMVEAILARVRQLGIEGRVHFTDWVRDEDAPALISLATVFAYPSFYEGFGLPPLEAMASGLPVICSNAASLPEVVGDAALLFDPADTGELARLLALAVDDEALRGRLRENGLAQAAKFTWDCTARQTLAVYEQAAAIHRQSPGARAS